MRRAGALVAAALLSLVLFSSGCDWVGSLTPFGIGTRDYSSEGANVNGNWVGKTGTGGAVSFQVGSDTVSTIRFLHVAPGCTLTFEESTKLVPVANGRFTVELDLDQGRFVATGNFTSATTCSGNYSFQALQAGICPSSGTGTFVADKVF